MSGWRRYSAGILLVAALSACEERPGHAPPDERVAVEISVRLPGASPEDAGTGIAVPLRLSLESQEGIELVGILAEDGGARAVVLAESAESVGASVLASPPPLPNGATPPTVSAWTDRTAALTWRVEIDGPRAVAAGIDWLRIEAAIEAAVDGASSAEDLTAVVLSEGYTVADLATVQVLPGAAAGPELVVEVQAETADQLDRRLVSASERLTKLWPEARIETSPVGRDRLQVKLAPTAFSAAKVHPPEIQAAIARFAEHRAVFSGPKAKIEVVQRPAPLDTAKTATVENMHGRDVRLTEVAEVFVTTKPSSYLRLGGAFVGVVTVSPCTGACVAAAAQTMAEEATALALNTPGSARGALGIRLALTRH